MNGTEERERFRNEENIAKAQEKQEFEPALECQWGQVNIGMNRRIISEVEQKDKTEDPADS